MWSWIHGICVAFGNGRAVGAPRVGSRLRHWGGEYYDVYSRIIDLQAVWLAH